MEYCILCMQPFRSPLASKVNTYFCFKEFIESDTKLIQNNHACYKRSLNVLFLYVCVCGVFLFDALTTRIKYLVD